MERNVPSANRKDIMLGFVSEGGESRRMKLSKTPTTSPLTG
jgi:hypothetical protein